MVTPVNLFEFEAVAKENLSKMAYDYFAGGASDHVTLKDNRAAYDRIKLLPRILRDVSQRDLSTTIIGQSFELPFIIAPMGFLGLAHPESELAIARAAGSVGVGMTLSTMSSNTLEDVADVATTPLWFQLYVYKNRDVTRRLVERAEAAGYTALVLTVDTPILGRREADIRNQWHLPPEVQVKNLMGSGMEGIGMDSQDSGLSTYIASLWDPSISWVDIAWLKSITTLPIILKGVLHPADAKLAVEHGADAIIISNHGGRQVDTSIATIDALPSIVNAVNSDIDILIDGAIRRGTDILKAIALGANGVLVGRPIIWGLSYDGQAGVEQVLNILKIELDNTLALCGCHNLSELSLDFIA